MFRPIVAILIMLVLPATSALAQTRYPETAELIKRIGDLCAKLPGEAACVGIVPATCESDAGDKCVCGSGQTCEATETSCACFTADPASVRPTRPASGIGSLAPRPLPPQFATIDVSCGADTFTISTGNDSGTCTATAPGSGGGGGGTCTDGSGNSASVDCDTGCTSASGAGSCSGP